MTKKSTKLYDRFDERIFEEIEFDYNKPHSAIAKKIKRSKSFVTYRIKKMEENGIIDYVPLIDYSKQGYTYYRIFIETTLSEDEIISKLDRIQLSTVWLAERYDRENFVFVVLAKTTAELQTIWETMYEELAEDVVSKNISSAFKIHHLASNFFYGGSTKKKYFTTGASEEVLINETEKQVLLLLNKEPKVGYRAIAKELQLNEVKAKKTIKGLEEKRIILGYQTLLNKNNLGIQSYKIFMSFDFSKKNKAKLIELLTQHPNVIYITESSFTYDLECEIYVYEHNETKSIINDLKEKFDFTRLVLSLTKNERKLI